MLILLGIVRVHQIHSLLRVPVVESRRDMGLVRILLELCCGLAVGAETNIGAPVLESVIESWVFVLNLVPVRGLRFMVHVVELVGVGVVVVLAHIGVVERDLLLTVELLGRSLAQYFVPVGLVGEQLARIVDHTVGHEELEIENKKM